MKRITGLDNNTLIAGKVVDHFGIDGNNKTAVSNSAASVKPFKRKKQEDIITEQVNTTLTTASNSFLPFFKSFEVKKPETSTLTITPMENDGLILNYKDSNISFSPTINTNSNQLSVSVVPSKKKNCCCLPCTII